MSANADARASKREHHVDQQQPTQAGPPGADSPSELVDNRGGHQAEHGTRRTHCQRLGVVQHHPERTGEQRAHVQPGVPDRTVGRLQLSAQHPEQEHVDQ